MLRKLKIRIDGKEYLVELEEEGVAQTPVAQQVIEQKAEVASVDTAVEKPAASVAAGDDAMLAPMPGTISNVLVKIGDRVEINQPVMILEAMKMENQIVAVKSGTVQSLHVSNGSIVNPGDALITITE